MQEKMSGVDPKIKKSINESGWESGDKREVAVTFGTKEEREILLHNLENEGVCEDVATFVKMNKRVVVPVGEISDNSRLKDDIGAGWFNISDGKLIYIDKDKNIAELPIDYSKIKSISSDKEDISKNSIHDSTLGKKFMDELASIGFNITLINNGNFSADANII
jgi:hypothetical protein